jgi:hypothetical protein
MLFCENCGVKKEESSRFCSECGKPFSANSIQGKQSAESISPGVSGWTWYWRTWAAASVNPAALYPQLGNPGTNGEAVKFFLITQFISGLVPVLFIVIRNLHAAASPVGLIVIPLVLLGLMVVVLVSWLFLYIGAWLFNFTLSIVGGASGGYPATFQTMAFSSAPGIIPFIGGLWVLIMLIVGSSQAHHTEIWRPIVAFILELFMIVFFVMICFLLIWVLVVAVHHL